MASRTIASPGVQITEQDLSILTRPIGATDVLITGFTKQGPTENLVNVSDITEFEQIYGTPSTAAERYLYHSAKQILNTSPANLMVSRLPYGAGLGEGYSNSYSALIYPISGNLETITTTKTYDLLDVVTVDGVNETELLTNLNLLGSPYSLYSYTTAAQNLSAYKSTNPVVDTFITQTVYNLLTSVVVTGATPDEVVSNTFALTSTLPFSSHPELFDLFNNYADDYFPVNEDQWISSETQNNGTEWFKTLTVNITGTQQVVTNYVITVSTYSESVDVKTTYSAVTSFSEANNYLVLPPISILLNDEQYNQIISNNLEWSDNLSTHSNIVSSFDHLGQAGIIVLNDSKTGINNLFEGYYVGIADNTNINPATNYDSLTAINTTQSSTELVDVTKQEYSVIPSNRLNFKLTEDYTGFAGNSLSESLESYPTGYDFGTASFDDSLILVLYKLNTSIYNQDTITLDYKVAEGYSGSLYSKRTQNNPTFGNPDTFFLDSVVEKRSNNIRLITNPYISTQGDWVSPSGLPAKKVRVSYDAKALYPSGVYVSGNTIENNDLGNVPLKLQRVLNQVQNDESLNIDVVAECGLGTIWAGAKAKKNAENISQYIFDEAYPVDIAELKNTSGGIVTGVNSDYDSIGNKFLTFVSDRKDHVFIADSLRYIFVNGKNYKTTSRRDYVFSNDIYWPLKNQFAAYQSSYACTYGNWLKVNDDITDQFVWIPSSAFAAAVFATTSLVAFPWAAPAGFNRGTLTNVIDLGITPNQKQSDLLYKINVNPIGFYGNDGYAIFGQKTLYRKPSAFDRINVRRLFLTLEKETKQLLKYYVFEPNTFTTRQRLIGSLEPTFDKARLNDGLYEYQIICDERNNTPDVIDNNELKISIYIKPVRTAEFILADFIGTRTGVTFSELIG